MVVNSISFAICLMVQVQHKLVCANLHYVLEGRKESQAALENGSEDEVYCSFNWLFFASVRLLFLSLCSKGVPQGPYTDLRQLGTSSPVAQPDGSFLINFRPLHTTLPSSYTNYRVRQRPVSATGVTLNLVLEYAHSTFHSITVTGSMSLKAEKVLKSLQTRCVCNTPYLKKKRVFSISTLPLHVDIHSLKAVWATESSRCTAPCFVLHQVLCMRCCWCSGQCSSRVMLRYWY